MANDTEKLAELFLKPERFTGVKTKDPKDPLPMLSGSLTPTYADELAEQKVDANDRFLSSLAALLYNVEPVEAEAVSGKAIDASRPTKRFDKGAVAKAIKRVDELIETQLNAILHDENFQKMEAAWRGLEDLVDNTNFQANITIELLDVKQDELRQDFESNSSDIFSSSLFKKVYIQEYDQYGGRPYGVMVGLYEFDPSLKRDMDWLERMSRVANASHCPFIAAVDYKFFSSNKSEFDARKLEAVRDLNGVLAEPNYSRWKTLRDSESGAYIGLTLPRYVLRQPWHPEKNPCDEVTTFKEQTLKYGTPESQTAVEVLSGNYLWGNSAILLARNLVKSFEQSGWCQSIRGPKGGGMIKGLPVDTFELRGQKAIQPPVEMVIPDYREFEFANNGFIPLVYRKNEGEATFFSTQSIKSTKRFKDPKDSENSQLVANLAYTFSITRIAHYIKCIMRDNIGSTADAGYIHRQLDAWLAGYVTTVVNPDDLTLRRFPFKATSITVVPKPGQIGWYSCVVSVLPHIQFEGLDVELRLESRLG